MLIVRPDFFFAVIHATSCLPSGEGVDWKKGEGKILDVLFDILRYRC